MGAKNEVVAIVPGARVYADGQPCEVLEDRLQGALEQYNSGKARQILVFGDHAARGYDEVRGMADWMRDHGVPDNDLLQDPAGFRTLDTMYRAAEIFGVTHALICTNSFHLKRSLFLARAAGINAEAVAVDRRVYATHRKNRLREWVAITRAILDVKVLRTRPRFR